MVTSLGATTLLAVVLVESALLVAVPMAAAAGDAGTALTAFALSNGVFLRVFPLAPSSATYLALGFVVLGSKVLPRPFGYLAIGIRAAFELAGLAAVFSGATLVAIAVLAAAQSLWIAAAAVWITRRW
jgi:hypothetical protein